MAVGFLSLAPLSQSFSCRARDVLALVLSRAELAARYLVVVQARVLAERSVDCERLIALSNRAVDSDTSVSGLWRRVRALRSVLNNLPRQGRRLLRRIERAMRCVGDAVHPVPRPETQRPRTENARQVTPARIERPPDKAAFLSDGFPLPPVSGGRRRRLGVRNVKRLVVLKSPAPAFALRSQ